MKIRGVGTFTDSFKMRCLIILVSLLAVAVCTPTFGLLKHIANIGHKVPAKGLDPGAIIGTVTGAGLPSKGRSDDDCQDTGYQQEGNSYPVQSGDHGGFVWQAFGSFLDGLTDLVSDSVDIIGDLVNGRIPGGIDDAFNTGISLSLAAGGIINALIPGLGTYLSNIVVAILKIFICTLGSPGLSGSIIGDRRPGRNNPSDIPYICSQDCGSKYGYGYDGKNNQNDIKKHYNCSNAGQNTRKMINDHTNGRGIDSMSGPERTVCQCVMNVADTMDKDCSKWTNDDMRYVLVQVITIVAVMGECQQKGLGRNMTDECITYLGNNKNKDFPDMSGCKQQVYDAMQGCSETEWHGAFRKKNRGKNNGSGPSDSGNQECDSSDDKNGSRKSNGSNSRPVTDSGSQQQKRATQKSDSNNDSSNSNDKKRNGSTRNANNGKKSEDDCDNSDDAGNNQKSDNNDQNNNEGRKRTTNNAKETNSKKSRSSSNQQDYASSSDETNTKGRQTNEKVTDKKRNSSTRNADNGKKSEDDCDNSDDAGNNQKSGNNDQNNYEGRKRTTNNAKETNSKKSRSSSNQQDSDSSSDETNTKGRQTNEKVTDNTSNENSSSANDSKLSGIKKVTNNAGSNDSSGSKGSDSSSDCDSNYNKKTNGARDSSVSDCTDDSIPSNGPQGLNDSNGSSDKDCPDSSASDETGGDTGDCGEDKSPNKKNNKKVSDSESKESSSRTQKENTSSASKTQVVKPDGTEITRTEIKESTSSETQQSSKEEKSHTEEEDCSR